MWLAQFVCAPQFFKAPKGLCGHTVFWYNSKFSVITNILVIILNVALHGPDAFSLCSELLYVYMWLIYSMGQRYSCMVHARVQDNPHVLRRVKFHLPTRSSPPFWFNRIVPALSLPMCLQFVLILSRVLVTETGFGFVFGLNNHSQVVTTITYIYL
jgi:hypothetical protein